MSRRLLGALVLACMAMIAGTLAYTASATVPTSKLYATMTGPKEAPGPGDPNANGVALVTLRPSADQVCVMIRFRQVDGTLSGLHIHRAPPGQPGPIVVDFTGVLSSRGVGCVNSTDALVTELRRFPRRFYLNLHSTPDFGAGAIRGQLADSDI